MTEEEIRALFPGTRDRVYLNAAATSLLPEPVARAMHDVAMDRCLRGDLGWSANAKRVEQTRAAVAGLIGAEPAEIAFVANTSEGIGRVACGLDWSEGDEVVLGDIEYPANVYPWAAQRDLGVRLRIVRSDRGRLPAQRLIDAIGPRTRVLAVSHVQFTNGYRVDLDALGRACRGRGVLFVVDAIQALGVFPVDVRGSSIGALAADGRKWLMGPQGTAFLFVSREWVSRIRPRVAGPLSVPVFGDHLRYMRMLDGDGQLPLERLLKQDAGRYEAGLCSFEGAAGLGEALDLGNRIGRERIRLKVISLCERLVEGLERRGWTVHGPSDAGERSGIVSFSVPGRPEEIHRRLRESGFVIALREGRLRASPHVYNSADEIDALLGRLDELAEE